VVSERAERAACSRARSEGREGSNAPRLKQPRALMKLRSSRQTVLPRGPFRGLSDEIHISQGWEACVQAARLRDNQPELPHGRRAHGCYMARGGAVTVVGLRGEPGHRRTTSSTRDHLASPPTAHVVRHRRLLELPCAPRAGVNVAVWEQVSAKRVRERGRRCASAVSQLIGGGRARRECMGVHACRSTAR
jgi:hypothetical protein